MKTNSVMVLKWLLLAVACCLSFPAHAAPESDVVEVPFDFHRDSIVVHAKVNGKGPFNLLLDTGVNPSVIDLQTAKDIGLKLAASGEQGKGGGSETNLGYETSLPLLELGRLTAKNIEAVAVNLSKTGQALGVPLHGVLGYSLLKNRIVQIDYPKHVARFYAKSPFPPKAHAANSPKSTTLPFHHGDDLLIPDISVNGKKLTANLDTGSNGSFQLTPAAVAELGLEAEVAQAQASTSVGFNGATGNRTGKIRNVTLGGISIDEPAVVFYGKGTGRDDEEWGIRIGNAFLKDFVVTIDYQNQLLTLERP